MYLDYLENDIRSDEDLSMLHAREPRKTVLYKVSVGRPNLSYIDQKLVN